MKKIAWVGLWLVFTLSLQAQGPLDKTLPSFSLPALTLENALYALIDSSGVTITFSNRLVQGYPAPPLALRETTVREILNLLCAGLPVQYQLAGNQIVLVAKMPSPPVRYTISGKVRDSRSGELLIGANIYSETTGKGVSTNLYGYFSLTLPAGRQRIVISYLGYQPQTLDWELSFNAAWEIDLAPSLTLSEVLIVAPTSRALQTPNLPGSHTLHPDELRDLPSLGGETDVLRLTYLLPGVQTGADGFGGLSIRGGDVDQNLFLLDGVPVYNAGHLLGIYSVFNSDAIKSAQLIKGVFPARYGGRVSSVLDVRTREGNLKKFEAEADIGLTSAKCSVEGPLKKGKSSFFLSARRALVDLYSRPFSGFVRQAAGVEGQLGYYFFDLNGKLQASLGKRDVIYLSAYWGGDFFDDQALVEDADLDTLRIFETRQSVEWGNLNGSLRWNHVFSNKLFANTTLAFSRFFYLSSALDNQLVLLDQAPIGQDFFIFRYRSNNRDFSLATDLDFIPSPTHYLRFGAQAIWHRFQPGAVSFDETVQLDTLTEESIQLLLEKDPQLSTELDIYAEDEIAVSESFSANIGLRLSTLWTEGTVYPLLQPRLNFYFQPVPGFRMFWGYGRVVQSLHLLTNSGIGLPRDLWVSSTARIRPVDSWQASAGVNWRSPGELDWTLEFYYKTMNGLITFQEGALATIDGTNWQNKVAVGRGLAYGAEFQVKKERGRLTGWIAYTLALARRQFDEVNLGEEFPFQYDRRHNVHLVTTYRFNRPWSLSLTWTYGSGLATTLPRNVYSYNESNQLYSDFPPQFPFVLDAFDNGRRNDIRLPAYHRLDLSAQRVWGRGKFKHGLVFGVYNAYNRLNPVYYFLAERPDENGDLARQYYQLSLLPAVPFVRYRIHFNDE